jgi:hypothetical protein
MHASRSPSMILLPLLAVACGPAEVDDIEELVAAPYEFDSAFGEGSAVSNGGQIFRQLLIDDMSNHLGVMTARLEAGEFYPLADDVSAELEFYFEFDSDTSGQVPFAEGVNGTALQQTYDDISSGKDLVSKLAGNDTVTDHLDWSTEFVGWDGVSSPESLVRHWFDQIDAQAVDWAAGDLPLDPSGQPVPDVFVTPEGLDLQNLLEKFLRGAVGFSQGTDDYLDDDTEGKGLLASHAVPEEGELHTDLEHAWDEGFGYFGAARSYGLWSDEEIADLGSLDTNEDGSIDLLTEVSWGHSINAAWRDRDAVVATELTTQAWTGFYQGRLLLSETAGTELSEDELIQLQGYRDQAVEAWEQAIAASVVHYINDTLQDMGAMGTEDYDFGAHARHWSELKGFALSFQFNPRSPMDAEDFELLHALIGISPVLGTEGLEAYARDLLSARTLVGETYGFDSLNLGDEHGESGW